MSRRRTPANGDCSGVKEMRDGNGGNGTSDSEDPDPAENFPQWSKSLLLLLDYAMIEGLRRGLGMFAHLLDMARLELHSQVTRTAAENDSAAQTGKNARGKKGRGAS